MYSFIDFIFKKARKTLLSEDQIHFGKMLTVSLKSSI